MVVGIDTYHDSAKKGRSVGGIVCSLNPKLTRYYSGCTFQMTSQELIDGALMRLRGERFNTGRTTPAFLAHVKVKIYLLPCNAAEM